MFNRAPRDGRAARRLLRQYARGRKEVWRDYKLCLINRTPPEILIEGAPAPVLQTFAIDEVPSAFRQLATRLVMSSGLYHLEPALRLPQTTTAERIVLERDLNELLTRSRHPRKAMDRVVISVAQILLSVAHRLGRGYFQKPQGLTFTIPIVDNFKEPQTLLEEMIGIISSEQTGLFRSLYNNLENTA